MNAVNLSHNLGSKLVAFFCIFEQKEPVGMQESITQPASKRFDWSVIEWFAQSWNVSSNLSFIRLFIKRQRDKFEFMVSAAFSVSHKDYRRFRNGDFMWQMFAIAYFD